MGIITTVDRAFMAWPGPLPTGVKPVREWAWDAETAEEEQDDEHRQAFP